jgi:hypothetical protein
MYINKKAMNKRCNVMKKTDLLAMTAMMDGITTRIVGEKKETVSLLKRNPIVNDGSLVL